MFARFCECIKDKWNYIMWWTGLGPMEAYFASMHEYKHPVKVKLDKKSYLTKGRKLRDGIYFIAAEYNPDDNFSWPGNAVLRVRPDYDRLRRGDYVVLYDKEDRIRIAKVTCSGWPSMPDLFDGKEMIGITHDIVGKIVDVF